MNPVPVRILALLLVVLVPSAAARIPPDSELVDQGGSYAATFEEPGTYAYHCHPHPSMTATIVVSDTPEALGGAVNITLKDYAFTPSTLTVRPGTVVTWTNEDPVAHTVTFERADNNTTPGNDSHMGGMDDHAMGNDSMGHASNPGDMHDEGDANAAGDASATTSSPGPHSDAKHVPTPALALIIGAVAVATVLSPRRA